MDNIKNFSKELEAIIQKNERLERANEMYKQQLLVIAINNGGRLKHLDYDDLNKIDMTKISIGVGFTSLSVSNTETNKILKSWDEVPLKEEKK